MHIIIPRATTKKTTQIEILKNTLSQDGVLKKCSNNPQEGKERKSEGTENQ